MNKTNKMNKASLALIIALLGIMLTPKTSDAQISCSLPWPAGDIWTKGAVNGTKLHGFNGVEGYDFDPVLSDGTVTAVCAGEAKTICAGGNQAIILLNVPGVGQFQYGHLDARSITIPSTHFVQVSRGQYLGRINYGPFALEQEPGCFEAGTYPHLHFNVPKTPIILDGEELGRCSTFWCRYRANGSGASNLTGREVQPITRFFITNGIQHTVTIYPAGAIVPGFTPPPPVIGPPTPNPPTTRPPAITSPPPLFTVPVPQPPAKTVGPRSTETVTDWWGRLFG